MQISMPSSNVRPASFSPVREALLNALTYDLRHNFATQTLMRWIDEGRDVMALMPYLSTYMGHVSLEETLYYIHLLPERLKSSPGIDWKMLNDIYQTEEGSDEED